jgi:hypothetical protein
MDALEYVTDLRIAPNGERLNPTQKLVLLLLVLRMDETGASSPKKDLLADQALVNTRSVKRVLAELEAMRLIRPLAQYLPTGRDTHTKYLILDAQGESVIRDTHSPASMLPDAGESVTESRGKLARVLPMTPYTNPPSDVKR